MSYHQELGRLILDHIRETDPAALDSQEWIIVFQEGPGVPPESYFYTVAKGGIDEVLVDPRNIFRRAIAENATGIVVAHTHPSGICIESMADRAFHRRMVASGDILGIAVLDCIIVTKKHVLSHREGSVYNLAATRPASGDSPPLEESDAEPLGGRLA